MDADYLIKVANSDGVVINKRPAEILERESFRFDVAIPPLHRPEVELLMETSRVVDASGEAETIYHVLTGDKVVKVGRVSVELRDVRTAGRSREEAVQKMTRVIGQAVAQAYVHLMTSDDPNKQAAARSMEIR